MMQLATVVTSTLDTFAQLLEQDDVIVDGGKSYYHDDIHRAARLKPQGIYYNTDVAPAAVP